MWWNLPKLTFTKPDQVCTAGGRSIGLRVWQYIFNPVRSGNILHAKCAMSLNSINPRQAIGIEPRTFGLVTNVLPQDLFRTFPCLRIWSTYMMCLLTYVYCSQHKQSVEILDAVTIDIINRCKQQATRLLFRQLQDLHSNYEGKILYAAATQALLVLSGDAGAAVVTAYAAMMHNEISYTKYFKHACASNLIVRLSLDRHEMCDTMIGQPIFMISDITEDAGAAVPERYRID